MSASTRVWILRLDAYDGDDTASRLDGCREPGALYCVVQTGPKGALILDNGYRTRAEAKKAWPRARSPVQVKAKRPSSGLRRFGPWRELSREEAIDVASSGKGAAHLLTLIKDGDGWLGVGGLRLVNVVLYFRSKKPLPATLRIPDVWLDESGQPVASHE